VGANIDRFSFVGGGGEEKHMLLTKLSGRRFNFRSPSGSKPKRHIRIHFKGGGCLGPDRAGPGPGFQAEGDVCKLHHTSRKTEFAFRRSRGAQKRMRGTASFEKSADPPNNLHASAKPQNFAEWSGRQVSP